MHSIFNCFLFILNQYIQRGIVPYNVPACQDTKLKNLSYILLPFLSAYAAIRYC